METGEVMLLFYHTNEELNNNFASMDIMLDGYSGADKQQQQQQQQQTLHEEEAHAKHSMLQNNMGHTFLSIASSPFLRSATLLIFVVSSTTLLVGIVIILDQFRKVKSRMMSSIEHTKDNIYRQISSPMEGLDQLVLDDLFQIFVKRGIELCVGICGSILLYSSVPPLLPLIVGGRIGEDDTVATATTIVAREVRRRILCAADPSLERTVFHPGGVWEMLSPKWRDCLVKTLTPRTMRRQHHICNSPVTATTTTTMKTEMIVDDCEMDDNASFDTPVVSSVPPSELTTPSTRGIVGGTLCSDDSVNMKLHRVDSRGTIQEDVLQQRRTRRIVTQPPLPISPPPPLLPEDWHLERILHRTSLVTTVLFVYHLNRSPTTRKAWGCMLHSLTSLGLVSTAISARLVSSVLRSNPSYTDGIVTPIIKVICATMMGQRRWNILMQVGNDGVADEGRGDVAMHRIRWMFHQLRNQIQRNKRYYLAVLMLYGMGRLSRRSVRRRITRHGPE